MKTSFDIPTTAFGEDVNTIELRVSYQLGGHNVFTGRQEGRGVYLSVTPCNVNHDGSFACRSFMVFGKMNFKMLVKPLNRKSQKAIDEVAAKVDLHKEEIAAIVEKMDERAVYDFVMSL